MNSSEALCAFTMLCNHQQYLIVDRFHHPKREPRSHEQSLPVPPSPGPWNCLSASCLDGFASSGHFIEMGSCGLLCLASFTQYDKFEVHPRCSMCQASFILMANISLYYGPHFVYPSPINGHLVCFHFLATVKMLL